jgi:hypothetical protein
VTEGPLAHGRRPLHRAEIDVNRPRIFVSGIVWSPEALPPGTRRPTLSSRPLAEMIVLTYQHEAIWGHDWSDRDRVAWENFHLFPGFGVGPVPVATFISTYQHEAVLGVRQNRADSDDLNASPFGVRC